MILPLRKVESNNGNQSLALSSQNCSTPIIMYNHLSKKKELKKIMIKESEDTHWKNSNSNGVLVMLNNLENKDLKDICQKSDNQGTTDSIKKIQLQIDQTDQIILPERHQEENNNIKRDYNASQLSYREFDNYHYSLFLTNHSEVPIKETESKLCCLYQLLHKFNSKYRLSQEIIRERDYIMFLNGIIFNNNDEMHLNLAKEILRTFDDSDDDKDTIDMTVIEEDSGFPLTMFAVSSMILLIDRYAVFLDKNKQRLMNQGTRKNYLFKLIKRLSPITIDMINNGKLAIYCNKEKSVNKIMEAFGFGLLEQALIELKALNDINDNLKEINDEAIETIVERVKVISNDSPSSILWKHNLFIEQYPDVKDSITFNDNSQAI